MQLLHVFFFLGVVLAKYFIGPCSSLLPSIRSLPCPLMYSQFSVGSLCTCPLLCFIPPCPLLPVRFHFFLFYFYFVKIHCDPRQCPMTFISLFLVSFLSRLSFFICLSNGILIYPFKCFYFFYVVDVN